MSQQTSPTEPKNAMTRSPSTTGVADAKPFLSRTPVSGAVAGASALHSFLPSASAKQWIDRCLPSALELVTKTRSPQTTGELFPFPGTGLRQRRFSLSDHFVGS